MSYKDIIKNIILDKNCIVTFIINMEESSKEELEILKLLIKDIKKKVKVTINNDNKSVYYSKDSRLPYYTFGSGQFSYQYFYKQYDNADDSLKLKNRNSTNILIFKDYFSTQIKNISSIILLIKDNEIVIIKNRYGKDIDEKINIPILLRKIKLQKMKKDMDNY